MFCCFYTIKCNNLKILKADIIRMFQGNLCNFIKIVRVKDWFYIIGIAFLGFLYKIEQFKFYEAVYLLIVASLFVIHGYVTNTYYDMKHEKSSSSKYYDKNTESNLLFYMALAAFLINMVISLLYSNILFVLVVVGGIVSFIYSSSWTRMKDKPFLNIILNSTGFTILFLIGYFFNKYVSIDVLYLSGYIWLGIIPSQIIHLLAHNRFERNWPLPVNVSLKFFYIFQLLWLGEISMACVFLNNIYPIFVLTLLFCITQIVIIKICMRRLSSNSGIFLKIRDKFKFVHIIFGLFFAIILILFKH